MEIHQKHMLEMELRRHFNSLESNIRNAESHAKHNSFGMPLSHGIGGDINSAESDIRQIKQILKSKFGLNI